MAGIYIHIPYCRQACHYCDFHFSVNQSSKSEFVQSLHTELSLQKNYLNGELIETIYMGGGTPSLLSGSELKKILEAVYNNFLICDAPEITLEANPDDLTQEKVKSLSSSEVNRLSIGVQSFIDRDLLWMNRSHTSQQAESGVKRSQDAGFENITIDLIYGLPDLRNDEWKSNLTRAFSLGVQHISCYSLTVEPRTTLAHFISTGKSKPVNEEKSASQLELLMSSMKEHGWMHYEISNFACEEKFISRHNSSYWKRKYYLGLGPSAHSFNGSSRQWNVANNHQYIESLSRKEIPFEREMLSKVQEINERLMTELRTMWGFSITECEEPIANRIKEAAVPFINSGYITLKNDSLTLTDKGKMIADKIILDLMLDE